MLTDNSFASLGIPDFLVNKLQTEDIKLATEVQSEVIPLLLQGKDLIAQSPTGTGKTLAYLLPFLSNIKPEDRVIQTLILAPTRELAMQIAKLTESLVGDQGVVAVPILGGVNKERQLDSLKKKPQIIIGTPGRVLELIRLRKINSQTVKAIVIDEADKMWKLGFREDVQAIIKSTLRDRQVVLVSATVTPEMVASTVGMLNEPELVNVSLDKQVADTIKHQYFMTQERNKAENLLKIFNIYKPRKAIVFINSNKGVRPFVRRFADGGLMVEGLHSELNPQERKVVLDRFRTGKTQMLVTTDLFARGMDVKEVDLIISFDLPLDSEHYLHRAGRTGRAQNVGLSVCFVTPDQRFIIAKYEKQLGISIPEYGMSGDKVFSINKGSYKNRRQ